MASISRRRGSRIWTAFYRDQNGRLHCRSTGTTDRKQAREIAGQYEEASRKKRTLKQVMRVIGDMHRLTALYTFYAGAA
jgi:hypothetical protein